MATDTAIKWEGDGLGEPAVVDSQPIPRTSLVFEIDYPATIRWDYLPKGSLRTHHPDFKPVDDPRRVEKTGDSVEALLIGK